MTYVMVPVPEELAGDVEMLLFQIKYRNAAVQWDANLIAAHMRSLAAEARTVLTAVAAGVLAHEPIEDVELATRLGVNVREVFGVVREANDATVTSIAGDLIGARIETVDDGHGGKRRRRVLFMFPWLAEMVVDEEANPAPT
jgi:plasmid stability protein